MKILLTVLRGISIYDIKSFNTEVSSNYLPKVALAQWFVHPLFADQYSKCSWIGLAPTCGQVMLSVWLRLKKNQFPQMVIVERGMGPYVRDQSSAREFSLPIEKRCLKC